MKPPFLGLNRFDLIIVPEHDRVKAKDNVFSTRITPNLIDQKYLQEQTKALENRVQSRKPRIGVLIGGDTTKYKITRGLMDKVVIQLKQAAENLNYQLLISTSRRTPETIEKLLKENFTDYSRCKLLVIANEKNIPEAVGGILGLSELIVVSGESISMISEAVSAEKYVLVFKPEKKVRTITKQDRFLERLEKDGILKIVQLDNLVSEIEEICKNKPYKKKIEDKE